MLDSYYVQFIAYSQLKPKEWPLVELRGECSKQVLTIYIYPRKHGYGMISFLVTGYVGTTLTSSVFKLK
jgi:hypothetical protein